MTLRSLLAARPSPGGADPGTTALLALVLFTSTADMLIVTPVLPQMASDLGVGVDVGGLWVTTYAASTGLFALLFGPISDRYGRLPVLRAGVGILALGTLACAFAVDFLTLALARFGAGMGAGLLTTSATSFVGDHFDGPRRAVAMGWVMGGFFLALVLSVPVGSTLAAAFGWATMFTVYGAFAFGVLGLVWVGLPRPRLERCTTSLSFGSALGSYGSLLADRGALGVTWMSFAIGLSMTMFMVSASPWLAEAYGFGSQARGLVFAVGGPAVIVGGPIAGRLSNRFGRVRVVVVASLLMAAIQVAMPWTEPAGAVLARWWGPSLGQQPFFGDVPWPLTVLTLLAFFGAMVAASGRSSPFQTLALEVVPSDRRGALSALRNTASQVGTGAGAALGGAIWAATGGAYSAVSWTAAGITLVGVAGLLGLVPSRTETLDPSSRVPSSAG